MMDVLRFWLERGIDGFRVDVIWEMIKDEQFRDNPPNPDYRPVRMRSYFQLLPVYNTDQPEVHDIVSEMRAVLDEHGDRVLIGEIFLPLDRLMMYYGHEGRPECHLPFNFQLQLLPWNARRIAAGIDSYEAQLPKGAWPNWVLGSHDMPRIASRAGPAQAGVAAMLLLTLRGTPTMYQGDEIGIEDVPVPEEMVQDPVGKRAPGFGRDPQRTPMQWDAGPNAGFSSARPWLPIAEDYRTRRVASQRENKASLLSLYRRLITLRRSEPALMTGAYTPVPADRDLIAYLRSHEGRRFLVVLNLGAGDVSLAMPEGISGRVVVCTAMEREGEEASGALEIGENEGLIVELP